MHNIIDDLRNISGTKAKIEYIKDLDTVQKEDEPNFHALSNL